MPAEMSDAPRLEDVLARLPHLTVHLVDLPGRWWVADPAALTCWVHKGGSVEERGAWVREAAVSILSSHSAVPAGRAGPRLHSVPR